MCVEAAYRLGKQLIIQPYFAKADRHFKGKEALTSAATSTVRLEIERVVSKQSNFDVLIKENNQLDPCFEWIMHGWHGPFSVILCLKVYCDKLTLDILCFIY